MDLEANDIMGNSEEREVQISEIFKLLGVATLGELTWVQRNLKRNFSQRLMEESANHSEFDNMKVKIDELLEKHQILIKELSSVQEEKESNGERLVNLQSELHHVKEEKMAIEIEKDYLKHELEKVGKLYRELTGEKVEGEKLSKLLSIYVTLMEKVFSGRVHFKILAVMHGDKQFWTREELVKSTGISEVNLRTALGELARAQLIEYNEETTESFLKERIENF